MGLVFVLGLAFTVWMAVEAVRRGHAGSWLWIILVFGPVGAAVYFFSECIDSPLRGFRSARGQRVTATDLHLAEAEVRRLDNAASWLGYASALRARNKAAQAVEAAQKAVERDALSLDAHYELAQALVAAGRLAEAAAPLQRVVAVNRSHDSETALYTLARAYLAADDLPAAHAALQEIASRSSRPEFLHEHARLLARLGQRDEAARVLQRIISEAELVPPYLQRDVKPWVRKARRGLRALGF